MLVTCIGRFFKNTTVGNWANLTIWYGSRYGARYGENQAGWDYINYVEKMAYERGNEYGSPEEPTVKEYNLTSQSGSTVYRTGKVGMRRAWTYNNGELYAAQIVLINMVSLTTGNNDEYFNITFRVPFIDKRL